MKRITVDKSSSKELHVQIAEQLRVLIYDGILKVGYRLAPERKLASRLGVGRFSVRLAYRTLKEQGLVASKGSKGTVVIERTDFWKDPLPEVRKAKAMNWNIMIARTAARLQDVNDEEIVEVINRRDIISLVGRWTSFAGFWTNEFPLPEEMQNDLDRHHDDSEIASPVEGLVSFREAISQMMFDGCGYCGSEDMVVTRGGRHGLDLIAHALINRNDLVVCEEPTYNWASLSFRKLGAKMVGIPMTPQGMDLDILEHTLKRRHIKFIYTMPTTQNPSGITTSLAHRTRLLDIAERFMVPIVEDDPYWGLGYTHDENLPTLRSMDRCESVIYIGTLSKAVSPRLELGWICAPREILRLVKTMLGYTMINSNTRSQLMMQRFIENKRIWAHIDKMREIDQQDDRLFRGVMQECDVPGVSWFDKYNVHQHPLSTLPDLRYLLLHLRHHRHSHPAGRHQKPHAPRLSCRMHQSGRLVRGLCPYAVYSAPHLCTPLMGCRIFWMLYVFPKLAAFSASSLRRYDGPQRVSDHLHLCSQRLVRFLLCGLGRG